MENECVSKSSIPKIKQMVLLFTNQEYGDHVRCTFCGSKEITLLLDCGEEKCPICNRTGFLAWVDDDRPERSVNDLEKDNYRVNNAKYWSTTLIEEFLQIKNERSFKNGIV